MDQLLEASLRLAADSAQSAYKAGYDEGYRAGAKWALEEAQKAVNDSFGKNVPAVRCGNCGADLSGLPCERSCASLCDRLVRTMVLHRPLRSWKQALRYLLPYRLTLPHNPRIHAWLWWNF